MQLRNNGGRCSGNRALALSGGGRLKEGHGARTR